MEMFDRYRIPPKSLEPGIDIATDVKLLCPSPFLPFFVSNALAKIVVSL